MFYLWIVKIFNTDFKVTLQYETRIPLSSDIMAANSPDLNPVDCKIWKLCMYRYVDIFMFAQQLTAQTVTEALWFIVGSAKHFSL